MRTIKFRGKNAKGEWLIGDLIHNRGEAFIAPEGIANPLATVEDFRVDPATVGQFTGLHDKDGKEIYEGDVVICRHGYLGSPKSPIREDKVKVRWIRGYYNIFSSDIFELEIIGNEHDHPELLKGE